MGRVWSWVIVRRSARNPYIRIPKDVLRELMDEVNGYYYVFLVEDKEDVKKIMQALERVRKEAERN